MRRSPGLGGWRGGGMGARGGVEWQLGVFGGGGLEHPRQRLGDKWPGLEMGGASRGDAGAELRHCQRRRLTALPRLRASLSRSRRPFFRMMPWPARQGARWHFALPGKSRPCACHGLWAPALARSTGSRGRTEALLTGWPAGQIKRDLRQLFLGHLARQPTHHHRLRRGAPRQGGRQRIPIVGLLWMHRLNHVFAERLPDLFARSRRRQASATVDRGGHQSGRRVRDAARFLRHGVRSTVCSDETTVNKQQPWSSCRDPGMWYCERARVV